MAYTPAEEKIEEKARLLTAMRMAIRQIQSGDYEVESTVETMPIPSGVNVKGFTKYTTGIRGIEFSLVPITLTATPTDTPPSPPPEDQS